MGNIIQTHRSIKKTWKGTPVIEGAGVHLHRVFGFNEMPLLDPFLLFDDFRSENPADYKAGFPWHPHRGMETITYVLDGDVEHGDSMGNKGAISAGDVQWMTAGSGIIHQEMPQGNRRGEMLGFQLWANLPAHSKMMDPRYQDIRQKDIPVIKTQEGASIRIICGTVNDVQGPVKNIVTDPEYLDITLPAGKTFTHSIKKSHTVFAYVIDGEACFDPQATDARPNCGDGTLVLYESDGSDISVTTRGGGVRFLLISGKPLNEPIAWRGPIVMNTREEIQKAFEEVQDGTFVRSGGL